MDMYTQGHVSHICIINIYIHKYIFSKRYIVNVQKLSFDHMYSSFAYQKFCLLIANDVRFQHILC